MHCIKYCSLLGLILASSAGAAPSGLGIMVFLYNYAGISTGVLTQAEAEAVRIYQHARIEIGWLDCPLLPQQAAQYPACQVRPGPTKLAVRLFPSAMADRMRQPKDTFGFALQPEQGEFPITANVFSNRAEELASRRGTPYGVILGHLIAHEIGHLLLGAESHSATGLMHVPWHRNELDIISQGLMLFEPRQAERMRQQIAARMGLNSEQK